MTREFPGNAAELEAIGFTESTAVLLYNHWLLDHDEQDAEDPEGTLLDYAVGHVQDHYSDFVESSGSGDYFDGCKAVMTAMGMTQDFQDRE